MEGAWDREGVERRYWKQDEGGKWQQAPELASRVTAD